jgi:hypothetical protein
MGLHRAPVIRPDHEMPDKEMADLKAQEVQLSTLSIYARFSTFLALPMDE